MASLVDGSFDAKTSTISGGHHFAQLATRGDRRVASRVAAYVTSQTTIPTATPVLCLVKSVPSEEALRCTSC